MESQLMKRVKSFSWRLGMATIAFSVEWMMANLGILDLSPMITGVLALAIGEVSKYLYTKTS